MNRTRFLFPLLPFIALFIGLCSATTLPGVYMDAVYPDYLVPRLLSGLSQNSRAWVLPGNMIHDYLPILGNVYHGTLPFWIGLPFYSIFGTDVVGIRITHMAFAALIIVFAWHLLRSLDVSRLTVALALSAMALDPAFHLAFRTQFTIVLLPTMFVLASLILIVRSSQKPQNARRMLILLSGILSGLSIYGYFIYLFYTLTIAIFVLICHNIRNCAFFVLGCIVGMVPMIYGLLSYMYTQGGMLAILSSSERLAPFSSNISLLDRFLHVFAMVRLVFTGDAVTLMMMGEGSNARLLSFRIIILLALPVAALILSLFRKSGPRSMIFAFAIVVVPPLLCGLLFGSRLWAHHFIPVLPFLYGMAALGIHVFSSSVRLGKIIAPAANALLAVFFFLNAVNFQTVIERLRTTGGVGMYSDSINRFAADIRGDKALYLMPDWGLLFPVTMITRSSIEVRDDFDARQVIATLCSRRDVVLASIGRDAEVRNETRLQSVRWPVAASSIYRQRDDTPWIYVTRWNASAGGACP